MVSSLLGASLGSLALALQGGGLARLAPPDSAALEELGTAAAAAEGLAVLGAPQASAVPQPGRALVFREGSAGWALEETLRASDAAPEDAFGAAVATDGARIAVGAPFRAVPAGPPGVVYVFERVGDGWVETARLAPPAGAAGDRFGSAVALSGERLAVGAPQRDSGALADAGAVFVFAHDGAGWSLEASIAASDAAAFDRFGQAVALDGARLAIGAPGNDDQGGLAGAAYVFEREGAGWLQREKLFADDASPLDRLGESIDLDGERFVVGAPSWMDRGAAYVFRRAPGGWVQEERLQPLDTQYVGYFAVSVAIEHRAIAVGAPYHDGAASNTGSVHLFHDLAGFWTEVASFVAPDGLREDLLGYSTALAGWTLVAGAKGADTPALDCGAGYAARIPLPLEGASYCVGDGSGSSCPCGNEGGAGRGCANSAGPGARLELFGSPSLETGALRAAASGLPPNRAALLLAGANAPNGGAGLLFGDGLRCVGGSVQRLGVRIADAAGAVGFGPGLAAAAALPPGQLARFQCWYRDPVSGPCGAGFNLSQGVALALAP